MRFGLCLGLDFKIIQKPEKQRQGVHTKHPEVATSRLLQLIRSSSVNLHLYPSLRDQSHWVSVVWHLVLFANPPSKTHVKHSALPPHSPPRPRCTSPLVHAHHDLLPSNQRSMTRVRLLTQVLSNAGLRLCTEARYGASPRVRHLNTFIVGQRHGLILAAFLNEDPSWSFCKLIFSSLPPVLSDFPYSGSMSTSYNTSPVHLGQLNCPVPQRAPPGILLLHASNLISAQLKSCPTLPIPN